MSRVSCATATSLPSSLVARARPTQAAEALAAAASWSAGIELPDPDDIEGWLRTAEAETSLIRNDGARHDDASAVVVATFSRPYLAHASIGPSCAIAKYDDGRLDVWSHSQGVFTLGRAIATTLDLQPEAVVVQHAEGAGSYGHNAADDVAMDAALLATRVPGRHVRVLLEPRRRIVLGTVRAGHGRRRDGERQRERGDH